MNSEDLRKGDVVLYTSSGGKNEVGVVRQVGTESSLVLFHTGSTAARTPNHYLHELDNSKELKSILNTHS